MFDLAGYKQCPDDSISQPLDSENTEFYDVSAPEEFEGNYRGTDDPVTLEGDVEIEIVPTNGKPFYLMDLSIFTKYVDAVMFTLTVVDELGGERETSKVRVYNNR